MPVHPPTNRGQAAYQAVLDATELAADVRELDPSDIWTRIAAWPHQRALTTIIALAAMTPTDSTPQALLAWTDDLRN